MRIKNFIYLIVTGVFCTAIFSCSDDDGIKGDSYIDTTPPELTELDLWIRDSFTYPYNIEVLYEWNENEVDQNRYLYPPETESVKPALEVVKHMWIDTYTDVGGEDFVKKIAPRQLLFVGGLNINPEGTVTLGLAEGGKKITFFETDFVDRTSVENINRFIGTIQHEYTHILNQTYPFDEEAYGQITPGNYTAQWYNNSIEDSRELGYISDYARLNVIEDFAEMVRNMLINSDQEWNDIIGAISSEQARADIRKKEAMVEEYFQSTFNISIYDLQDTAAQHRKEILE